MKISRRLFNTLTLASGVTPWSTLSAMGRHREIPAVECLRRFCGHDQGRYDLSDPFFIGDHIWATNGSIMARLYAPWSTKSINRERRVPDLFKAWKTHTVPSRDGRWSRLPEQNFVSPWNESWSWCPYCVDNPACDECDGKGFLKGSCYCEFLDEELNDYVDCPNCDGLGWMKDRDCHHCHGGDEHALPCLQAIGTKFIKGEEYLKISSLPGVSVRDRPDDVHGSIVFHCENGVAGVVVSFNNEPVER